MDKWKEYNNGISLQERDIADILNKARQSTCSYFMQLNLQGRGLWVGFREPFEYGIDRLHALYYKVRTDKGHVYMCLSLWRKEPSANELHLALMSANASVGAVIDSSDISEFMHMGETQHLVLRRPTHQPGFDSTIPSFVNY